MSGSVINGIPKWELRGIGMALHYSTFSKDPSTKVGSCLMDPYRVFHTGGYNGFPPGVKDSPSRYEDRGFKYPAVTHAETNALDHCQMDVHGWTMFVWPVSPCSHCAGRIITRGITTVIAPLEAPDRMAENHELADLLFEEGGVVIKKYPRQQIIEAFEEHSPWLNQAHSM